MVCPSAIAKAFGLDAATRWHSLYWARFNNLGRTQQVWACHPLRQFLGSSSWAFGPLQRDENGYFQRSKA
jgi:hypothetical protein